MPWDDISHLRVSLENLYLAEHSLTAHPSSKFVVGGASRVRMEGSLG